MTYFIHETLVKHIHRCTFAISDTVSVSIACSERQQIGTRHISHIYIILLLFAIPIDLNWCWNQNLSSKEGSATRLSQRVLSGAIDIPIAQDGKVQVIHSLPEPQIILAGHFR